MTLDAMNNSGFHLTWKTLGRELKALDAMNSLRLWASASDDDIINIDKKY